MRINVKRRKQQRGTAMVELAISTLLFWVPLFLGTYQIGFQLVREVMVTQICRDAGHMYSQGKDFTQPTYIALLKSLAPASLTMTATGNTTVYLSKITFVDSTACTNAGLQATAKSCPNLNNIVVMEQIPIGSTSLRTSHVATPSSSICNASNSYAIQKKDYASDTSVRVTNSPIALTSSSQKAYVSEISVTSSDLSFWSILGTGGNYAQFVF